jgi:hypothetical protein
VTYSSLGLPPRSPPRPTDSALKQMAVPNIASAQSANPSHGPRGPEFRVIRGPDLPRCQEAMTYLPLLGERQVRIVGRAALE